MRFTDRSLKSLAPRERVYELVEGDGFMVRVQPTGTVTFYYIYQEGRKNKRVRIGRYPETTLAEAREIATSITVKRVRGEFNGHVKDPTVNDLSERYLKEYSRKRNTPKIAAENARTLNTDILPFIGKKKVSDVKRADIHSILKKVIDRGAPIQSNRVLKVVRKMFNYGIEVGLTEGNPAHMIKGQPEGEKNRVLGDDEIKTFLCGDIPGKMSRHTLRCLRLILVTGQRPGECLEMLYEEIDGDWWTIPKNKTKNVNVPHAGDHRVYLTSMAREIIGEGSGRVFPQPSRVQALSYAIRRLFQSKRLPMDQFTPHDLRRTCATGVAELGFDQDKIDRMLGHVQGKIARTYNRYQYDKEKAEMMTAWEKKLMELPKPCLCKPSSIPLNPS